MKRIVCGLSGGVDSSVAALLLKKKGYDVVGVFMRNWDVKDETGVCSADKDAEHAEKTCRLLDIPFREVNFVKEYWNEVFVNLVKDYEAGLTPNPDIQCNQHIKFDSFFAHACDSLGADAIATGHYARNSFQKDGSLVHDDRGAALLMAQDSFKDQTFFLCHIKQSSLQKTLFPIGNYLKHQVRKIASEAGMHHVASRPDSTGICFIGKKPFQSFIDQYIARSPGDFVDVDTGQVVGHHQGIHMWTLGQRCRIAGQLKPYFTVSKLADKKTILVASGTDHPALYSKCLLTGPPHWIRRVPVDLNSSLDCWFRFQHTKPLVPARIEHRNCTGLRVTLSQAQRSITPGQYAVFYSPEECLGCARIVESVVEH